MTLDEYISEFDPKHVSSNSVAFDMNKLNWMNGIYIRKLSVADLAKKLEAFLPADFPREKIFAILPLIHDRLVTLAEVEELTEFFYRPIELDFDLLSKKATAELLVEQLDKTIAIVKELASWGSEALETTIRRLQEENDWKKSQYFMMLRIAVTGRKATPPLFETMEVIGKELLLERLQTARHLLG